MKKMKGTALRIHKVKFPVAVLREGQGGHGPRPRTFGNAEGAPHLRKN